MRSVVSVYVPKYKTRRLPGFVDSKGRRVTARLDLVTGEILFARWSRVVARISMAQLFALVTSETDLRESLTGVFALSDLREAQECMEKARCELLAASERVVSKTRAVSASFSEVYRGVLGALNRDVG